MRINPGTKVFFGLVFAAVFIAGCRNHRDAAPIPSTSPTGAKLDYFPLEAVLGRYVESGAVKYRSLKSSPGKLDAFLNSVARVGPESTPGLFPDRASQTAFWINVHNAAGLRAAVRAYPTKSVRPLLGRFRDRIRVTVDGRVMTLSQIADLARQTAGFDPRIELALVLPAKSAGPWPTEPYRADRLDTQLNRAVTEALKDPKVVFIDHEKWAFKLADPIYRVRDRYIEAYRKACGVQNATMVNALGRYTDATGRRRLNAAVGYPVVELKYDWSLNEKEEPPCTLDPK